MLFRSFGAEPAGAADCAEGFKMGRRVEDVRPDTICDGLRTPVGALNFPIIRDKVEDIIVVSDEVRAAESAALSSLRVAHLTHVPLFAGSHRSNALDVGKAEDRR